MPAEEIISIDEFIEHSKQSTYFSLPFHVDRGTESIEIRYQYARYDLEEVQTEAFLAKNKPEINIIDFGLVSPDGEQIGMSGSDKTTFFVSETLVTPGYKPGPILPGEWKILVGAYKIEPAGVKVFYEIKITAKSLRLLKGDLHTHTFASDGVHSMQELAWKAKRNGLDFVAITDHNQMVSKAALPLVEGITLIPGVEWTHYDGHSNFLGVDKPFDGCFATNSLEETQKIFLSAHERGALITINHPYEEGCEFKFDLEKLHFDCLEIWNGPMRESNLKAVGLWQALCNCWQEDPGLCWQ